MGEKSGQPDHEPVLSSRLELCETESGSKDERACMNSANTGRRVVSRHEAISCSFCHKPMHEVGKIVSDDTGKVFICEKCIEVCYKGVSETPNPSK